MSLIIHCYHPPTPSLLTHTHTRHPHSPPSSSPITLTHHPHPHPPPSPTTLTPTHHPHSSPPTLTPHPPPSLLTPMSVVSALSTFQDKFSISTSSCACWYSNCDDVCGGGRGHQIYQMLTRSGCTAYQWLSISLHEVSIWVGILQCIAALYSMCAQVRNKHLYSKVFMYLKGVGAKNQSTSVYTSSGVPSPQCEAPPSTFQCTQVVESPQPFSVHK